MIDWILQQLEKQPSRLFYEKELMEKDAAEFAILKEERLLTYVQTDERFEAYGLGRARPLTVIKISGQLYGIDDEDPDVDPIPLKKSDLAKYRFCLDQFANRLLLANNLFGVSFRLDRRQFFLGKKTVNQQRVAFVFGLFDSDKRAQTPLLSLPAQLGHRVDSVVVITPSYEVGSASLTSQLDMMQIHVVAHRATEDWKVDTSSLAKEVPHGLAVARLTVEQESDYELYGYKCRLPIYVSGRTSESGSNLVEVGDNFVEIGDTPFRLFLRLVLELRRDKMGTVSKIGLKSEGYLSEDGEFQSIGRLRHCFIRALGDLNPKKFIEAYRPKTLRLSVHPELVTWDQQKLLEHDDARVRGLVEKLAAVGQSHIR